MTITVFDPVSGKNVTIPSPKPIPLPKFKAEGYASLINHSLEVAGLPQRFCFDLANGFETIRDYKGAEARDLYQAIEEAQVVLDELRKNGVLSEDEEGWLLLIKDARKVTLLTLPVMPRVPKLAMAS